MGGIEQTQLPYSGTDAWIRLTLVLGAPALVALAGGDRVLARPSPRPVADGRARRPAGHLWDRGDP